MTHFSIEQLRHAFMLRQPTGHVAHTARRRAAVLIALTDELRPHLLLTVRSASLSVHAGQISLPGGRFDADTDRSLLDTARREAAEEVALPSQHVEVIGTLPDYPTHTGFEIRPVVAIIPPHAQLSLRPNAGEVADIFYTPFDWFLDEKNYIRKPIYRDGQWTPVLWVPWRDRNIWGITAALLDTLRQHLQAFS